MRRSILASILIGLGVYALLNSNYSYLSMILFAFGLYTICLFKLDLFTGKCGYSIDRKYSIGIKETTKILIINLIAGDIVGLLFSTNPIILERATEVINNWDISISYFIKSIMCGSIMFLAVHTHKEGSPLGIFFGVPLFIICGFQHSIANVIILGCGQTFSYALLLAILGNWIGGIVTQNLLEGK